MLGYLSLDIITQFSLSINLSLKFRTNNATGQTWVHNFVPNEDYFLHILLSIIVFPFFHPRPVNMMFCCRLSDGERHRLFGE